MLHLHLITYLALSFFAFGDTNFFLIQGDTDLFIVQDTVDLDGPVFVGEINGVINPVVSEYMQRVIEEAERSDAQLVIFKMDTPGGLYESTHIMVESMLNSTVPIAVFVYPRGARAASAGVFITMAANIAAMAPGTHIGAAHPVFQGGSDSTKVDPVMMKKIENDAVAFIKSIAKERGRNIKWAEKAVRSSETLTADEALQMNVIDLIATDVYELLDSVDNKVVKTKNRYVRLHTASANTIDMPMSFRERLLMVLANPSIAYILFMIGIYGLIFELSHPGAIFPGVIGGISMILALYAFQTLPVNYAGVALMVFALALFIAEIYIQSHGVLAIGGLISLTMGSILLFNKNLNPIFRVSYSTIALFVALTAALFFLVIFKAVQVMRRKPVTGMEGLIGEEGVVKQDVTPRGGMVLVHGELWQAYSDEPLPVGTIVVVEAVKGLKIKVKKKEDASD